MPTLDELTSKEKQSHLQVKGLVMSLSVNRQIQVEKALAELQQIIGKYGATGLIAMGFLMTKMAAED